MKQKMKRLTGLLLAVMMVIGTFTATAASLDLEETGAGTHTVYYCYKGTIPDDYTVKANCNIGDNNTWKIFDMTDTGSTYQGYKIYSGTVEEKYGGFDKLQFQQYDSSGTWKSQEVAISGWTTSSTFSGRMYYNGSWMDYTTDNPDVTETTSPSSEVTTTIYLNTSAVSGWGSNAYYDVANTTNAWSGNRFHPNSGNNLSSYGSMTKVSDNLFMAEIKYDPSVGMIAFSNANMHTYGDYNGNSAVVVKDYTGTVGVNNLVTLKSSTVSTTNTNYYDYELGTYGSQETTTSQPDTQPSTQPDTNPTQTTTTTGGSVITDTVKATAFSNAMWVDTQPETANTKVALVKAYEGSSGYRLYLPSGVDRSNLTIYHSFSSLSINGTTITSGNTYDMTNWSDTSCSVNGSSKSFKIFQSTAKSFYMYTYSKDENGNITGDKNLPTATNSSLTSKSSVSEKGSYMVVGNDGTVTQTEDILSSVKGRGNSSWEASYKEFGKYAYNIKINTAIKLGGSSSTKSKKWCLLANNADEAMMRNTVVYNLADSIGLEDSPMSDIYDVYNNGNYLGTYQITEKVEVSSSKALVEGENVDKMNETANPTYDFDNPQRASSNGNINEKSAAGYYKYCTGLTTPANYKDGDYLLEFELDERFPDEISGFISNRGQQVVLKTPEVATKDEVIYIMDKFNAAEAVAYAQSGSSTTDFAAGSLSTSNGKYTYTSKVSSYSVTVSSYDELIDAESFAQNYLVQEYVENLDGVATSFYVNLKNQDSLFTATPVWDFDWTMGQYGNSKKISSSKTLYPNNTDQWFIREKAIYNNYDVDNLVTKLCKIDDFWSRVKIQWKYNVYPEIQKLCGSSGLIKNDYTNKLSASVAMNEDRYHFIANDPIGYWGSANTGSTWSEAVNSLESWASSRATWINNNIGTAVSYTKSGTSTQLSVSQAEDNSVVAVATPGTITADSTTLGFGDYTYEFTYTNGTDSKTITKIGSNTVTLSDTATAGDVYTVSVSAYPTKAGKDTGFVLSSDEVSYTVTSPTDPKLTVSPTTLSLTVGDTSTVTAKKTNIDENVTWSTDNEGVATVDNGVVTAVAEGTATITATAGGLSATCVVTVSEPVSSIITLYFTNNKNWSSVKAWIWNDTTKTNESAKWPGKDCQKIGTNSQNQDIYSCTMDTSLYDSIKFNNGSDSAKTKDIKGITAADNGTGYYINSDSSEYEVATYSVVTPAVKLSTSSVELMVGGEYTITPASSKGTLSYESSNTAVATVDEKGVVKAVAKGNATITVTATGTFETATATLNVTVNDKYTVTFKNYDGTVISTQKYDAGETVVVPTETPVKPADKQYTYTFSGWDKDIVETVNADATYTAVFTGTLNKYSVSVSTVNGTVTGCPTEDVDYGTTVTLNAKANDGYTFAGYYVGDTRVSSSSTYTFTVKDNTEVVARFTQLPGAELKVQVVGGTGLKVKIGANGVETTQSIFYDNKDVKTGQYVTLTPTGISGYDFLYWIDDSGKIVAYSEAYTFMFTSKITLTAVYSQASAGVVTFMSGYNQINSSMCYGSADEITLPTPYTKAGYTFKFWSIDGKAECTASDIYTASQSGNVTVKAVYEAEEVYYNLTINGGTIVSVDKDTTDAGNTTGSYKKVNLVKVQANDAETGKKFAYWTDQDGKVLSYSTSCYLYLNKDTTITAVYVDESETVEKTAIAEISAISYDDVNNKMGVTATIDVPDDCIIVSGGLLATNDLTVGSSPDNFTYENALYKKVVNKESSKITHYEYNWTKSLVNFGDIWFLRAYVTYKDANGNTYEVYGDVVTNESLFS